VEPVIGRATAGWAATGFAAGAILGWVLGLSLGSGRLAIPGLAPLVAGGAGVAALVLASFFAALLGLSGALAGTAVESRGPRAHRAHKSHRPSFVERLPVFGAFALAALMAYSLLEIASAALGTGEPSGQGNRVTWNQKNATRVGGGDDREVAAAVLRIAFPATRAENRPGTVVAVPADWRGALATTPLIARPLNAALWIQDLPGMEAEASRLGGLEVPPPAGADPAAIAAAVDERRARSGGGLARAVMIAAADADPRWSLPAGAYAARTGTPILFVTRGGVPPATAAALRRRNGGAAIFVLGPEEVVAERVLLELRSFGTVRRIAGSDPYENAVRFAEFHDEAAGFGWGHSGRGARRFSATSTILVNGDSWKDGVAAAHLARGGKSGPLLLTPRDRLPPVVDNYLWRQRPRFASTPAEGPFNHVWIVGGFDRISYGVQAWADYSQEIEQYMTLGDSAVSGFEGLALAWIFLSIASAVWIAFHSVRCLPDVMSTMKAAWAIFALLLGPAALVLYVLSYHRRTCHEMDGMTMWQRPHWLRVVSATVMMFGFDMMLMVLAVFALGYRGFPIVRMEGPLYWLGTSMFLMMVLMYVLALLAMMLIFHTPMTMHERKIPSYGRAFLAGLPVMLATMTMESLGMMPAMWWAQMSFLPGMQMPTEDDLTMWATLLMAVAVGFLVVLPFNAWLVRRGTKQGTM
jgi:hypothetical protein